MLVNKKRKWKTKLVPITLALAVLATAGTVSAASKSAYLDGSGTSKSTATLTASNNSTGNIYATNTGGGDNSITRGYGMRSISLWPDSTVASTDWLNPGNSQRKYFTQTKDYKYYGKIAGHTTGSRGSITITVN